ncbi:hypothetical protein KVT40_001710 [Elsinoe batatas]|uniref:Uncharacterized protein n=1 Tax=Elsinoe batatas TaxID=2601811 RepID=A0A8K0PHI9_9PEZI|nr:hypothetical protein KVT40_001710 [Elsinoe batatas]
MAKTGKSMTWDAEADRKLLLAILKTSGISIDYKAVATEMSTAEITCTANAIMHRIGRLKEMGGVAPGTKGKGGKRGAEAAGGGNKTKRAKTGGEKVAAAKGGISDEDEAVKEDDDVAGAIKEEDEADSE